MEIGFVHADVIKLRCNYTRLGRALLQYDCVSIRRKSDMKTETLNDNTMQQQRYWSEGTENQETPNANGHHQMPEKGREGYYPVSVETWLCWHLEFGFLVPRTEKLFPVVLSCEVSDSLLHQSGDYIPCKS